MAVNDYYLDSGALLSTVVDDQLDGAMLSSKMHDGYYQFPSYSGLNCYNHLHHNFVSRKRVRESELNNVLPLSQKTKLASSQTYHQDQQHHQQQQQLLLLHDQQQKYEINRFIAQHAEKMMADIEERTVRQTRKLLSAIQDEVLRKLKEKDKEIERVTKMNWVLQEKVKNLCSENQLWRELAQTNEATANFLRTNLEQVLAAQDDENRHPGHGGGGCNHDDAASSCGSNCVEARDDGDLMVEKMCKSCGARESIVLLLPCRHLCLCTICGSSVINCPLCHSGINASVHVNSS